MKRLALILSVFIYANLYSQEKQPFQELDVFELEWVADPQISPDGSQIVYRRMGMSIMEDKKTGKKLEYEISVNAADPLAAQIQDYDWADEVLHVHTGRRWLLPQTGLPSAEAVRKGWEIRASTVDVLKAYEDRGEQRNWWPKFVREVLGHETAHKEFDLGRL